MGLVYSLIGQKWCGSDMSQILMTPIKPNARSQYVAGDISVFSWFVGVRIYGLPGEYLVPGILPGTFAYRFMIPYVEETLETLYEKNALLIVTGKDYKDTDPIDPLGWFPDVYWQPSVCVSLRPEGICQGKQLLVTFDLRVLRPSQVQLFVNRDFQGSFDVQGRCKRAVLFDTPSAPDLYVFLRPASNELYIYSVQVDVL
jgi:hypothetical protein